jgi:hypothetical protein
MYIYYKHYFSRALLEKAVADKLEWEDYRSLPHRGIIYRNK